MIWYSEGSPTWATTRRLILVNNGITWESHKGRQAADNGRKERPSRVSSLDALRSNSRQATDDVQMTFVTFLSPGPTPPDFYKM